MILKYVDGPTSSGKSHVLRNHACKLAATGENVIVALPTIDLINEYAARFSEDHPSARVETFHSKNERPEASSVKVDVKHVIEGTLPGAGRTIIVTHATFASVRLDAPLSNWHVLLDEELDVFKSEELKKKKRSSLWDFEKVMTGGVT